MSPFPILRDCNCASILQISEIKFADIPDVDLSRLGEIKYGNFSVEVVDPVSDYLELMEVIKIMHTPQKWKGRRKYISFWKLNMIIPEDWMKVYGSTAECIWFPTHKKFAFTFRFQVRGLLIALRLFWALVILFGSLVSYYLFDWL